MCLGPVGVAALSLVLDFICPGFAPSQLFLTSDLPLQSPPDTVLEGMFPPPPNRGARDSIAVAGALRIRMSICLSLLALAR